MLGVPNWEDIYINDIDCVEDEVKKYYLFLKEKWLNKEYIKISEYDGENTSYYFYFLEDFVLTNFHRKTTKKMFIEIDNILRVLIDNYKNDHKKFCRYSISLLIDMAKCKKCDDSVTYWKNYYLENKELWFPYSRSYLPNFEYYKIDDYAPLELFPELFSISSFLTNFGKNFKKDIIDLCKEELIEDFKKNNINYIYRFSEINVTKSEMRKGLYNGTKHIEIENYKMCRTSSKTKALKEFIWKMENKLRDKMNLPKKSEGWLNETILYSQIKNFFSNEEVIPHAKLDFLKRQHYDIYLPGRKVAIEYQGIQHNEAIEYFGGEEGLKKNKIRDERKKKISIENGVHLIEVFPNYNIQQVIKAIAEYSKEDTPIRNIDKNINSSEELTKQFRERKNNFTMLNVKNLELELSDEKLKKFDLLIENKNKTLEDFSKYIVFSFNEALKIGLTEQEGIELLNQIYKVIDNSWLGVSHNDYFDEANRLIQERNNLEFNKCVGVDKEKKVVATQWQERKVDDYYINNISQIHDEIISLNEFKDLEKKYMSMETQIKRLFDEAKFVMNEESYISKMLFRAFVYFSKINKVDVAKEIAEYSIKNKFRAGGKYSYEQRLEKL